MALDERYVLVDPLNPYFVKKNSDEALANGTLEFYRDAARTTPKKIYTYDSTQSPAYVELTNPLTLSGVGTIVDDSNNQVPLYLYPYITDADGNEVLDLYYMVGKDSDGVEQFSREAIPNVTGSSDPVNNDNGGSENQLSNPQFSQTFLNGTTATALSFTNATNETVDIAPNWYLKVSCTGTVTITLTQTPVAGNDGAVTRPAYALDIDIPSGVTKCELVQRLFKNSGLWTTDQDDNVYLSGSLTVQNIDAGTRDVELRYRESSGRYADGGIDGPVLILNATGNSGSFSTTNGVSAQLEASDNTNSGDDTWVEIYLNFLNLPAHVQVTSTQVIPTYGSPDLIQYQERSVNRELALMSDYYTPELNKRFLKSYLVGWDFPLNPSQFKDIAGGITLGKAGTAAEGEYICDQTISGYMTGALTVSRDPVTNGLKFTNSSGNAAGFYLLQFLDGETVNKLLGRSLSVNINAYELTTSTGTIECKVRLYRGTAASNFPDLDLHNVDPSARSYDIMATIDTSGDVSALDSGWSEISRSGLPTAKSNIGVYNVSNLSTDDYDYGFSQWAIDESSEINDTDKFAIIVTFPEIPNTGEVTVNSISLVPGEIPTRPMTLTFDQTLRECQRYYYKSSPNNEAPQSASTLGAIPGLVKQTSNATGGGVRTVTMDILSELKWPAIMRAVPNIDIWDLSGSTQVGAITGFTYHVFINHLSGAMPGTPKLPFPGAAGNFYSNSVSTTTYVSNKCLTIFTIDSKCNSGDGITFPASGETVLFHVEADARIGVV